MSKDQDQSKNNSEEEMNRRNNSRNSSNSSHSSSGSNDSRNTNTSTQTNRSGQQLQTQNRRIISEHPSIPIEVGAPNCPICLSRVQDRAFTNSCLHEFCLPCIREWSQNHNRCPVCRERYTKIVHNIRSSTEYDELSVEEPATEGDTGILITNGYFGLIATPMNSGVYIINPILTPHGMRYDILFLAPNQTFLMPNMNPEMIIARPQNLEHVLTHLDHLGMRRPHPHHGSHPMFLQTHRHNQHNHQQENQDPNNSG